MIKKEVLDTLYQEATEALLDYRIAAGLAQAQVLQYHCNDRTLVMQLEAVCKDYESMCSFIRQGGIDPERHQMQRRIANRALEILDAMHRSIRIDSQQDDYACTFSFVSPADFSAETSRKLQQRTTKEEQSEAYALQDRIFGQLWTMGQLTPMQTALLDDFIRQQSPSMQRHFVAGIMMALWEYFDLQKFQMLYAFMAEDDIGLRAQATLAYTLVHMRYMKRLLKYPSKAITTQSPHLQNDIRIIQHFLYMQKNCLKIYDRLAKDVNHYIKNGYPEEEREELLNETMHDRADLNPRTFVVAYKMSFFQHMSTWWMPYDSQRPEIKEMLEKAKDQSLVKIHDFLLQHCCDVDMYAIIQMLGIKGIGMKTSMFANPSEEIDQSMAQPEKQTPRIVYSLLMQNLYRFFTYSKWNKAYPNPFEMNIYLPAYPTLAIHFDIDSLQQLHGMLMRTQTYNAALMVADDIAGSAGSDEHMLLDCGICHQEQGNLKAAVQCYRQAELLIGDDYRLLKRMANCYIELGFHMEALECLERIAALPERVATDNYLPDMAECHLKLKDYENAQQCYFEMKYHNQDTALASRGIIWCAFQMKQYQKARGHSQQFLEQNEELVMRDHIIAGHIEWADGKWAKALSHYQKGIKMAMDTHSDKHNGDEWNFIKDDWQILKEHGITKPDMMLMHDILCSPE